MATGSLVRNYTEMIEELVIMHGTSTRRWGLVEKVTLWSLPEDPDAPWSWWHEEWEDRLDGGDGCWATKASWFVRRQL